MNTKNEVNVTFRNIFAFAWHYWRRRKWAGVITLLLMMSATVMDTFVPVYVGKIIDVMIRSEPQEHAGFAMAMTYLGIFAALQFAINILNTLSMMLWDWFAVRNLYEVVSEGLRKVQRFSSDWHANTFAGATVRKLTRGMWSFDLFSDTIYKGLLPALVVSISMSAILIVKVPMVGLFTLGMMVIYCAVSVLISVKILAPRFVRSAAADTAIGANLADIITGNPTVKSFGREVREDERFDLVALKWRKRAQNAWLTADYAGFARAILRSIMMWGMLMITLWMWRDEGATPGDIAFVLTSFTIISGYLRDIGMHITNMQKSMSEIEDVVEFWLRDVDVKDKSDASEFRVIHGKGAGEIVFDNVTFTYEAGTNPIYQDFSITIRPGENVALVGPSGSGKSTFVKLVQRLYDIDSGAIRIDGQNIADVTQESLRRGIALVPQEPILFHRSLAENIAYGRPDATMDEIVEAAKQAYAHDFIQGLSKGYDTLVGERGVKLSGGERQRVAIARAILADAPILILDEATSSLDSVSEHYIQMALENLMKDKTTITVAHRLATIKKVDRILVFERGRIVEQGTHAELVKRPDSHYRELYEMQALDLVGNGDNDM